MTRLAGVREGALGESFLFATGQMEELERARPSHADTRGVDDAIVRSFRVEVAPLTAGRVGLQTQMGDAVKRYGVEEARVLKAAAETADSVGRNQR